MPKTIIKKNSPPASFKPEAAFGCALQKNAIEVLRRLNLRYPEPKGDLTAEGAWQLMVATILAAQCTDERVNSVTPTLFARWPGPKQMAEASLQEVEEVIRPTGFFRNKAKHLIANASRLMQHYNGQVPDAMQDLISLAGVARKTANIVLWGAFGKNEGLAVDTHVKRIAFRLGLTSSADPLVLERDLMALFPQDSWGNVNHMLVHFGREVCAARKPNCASCPLSDLCARAGLV